MSFDGGPDLCLNFIKSISPHDCHLIFHESRNHTVRIHINDVDEASPVFSNFFENVASTMNKGSNRINILQTSIVTTSLTDVGLAVVFLVIGEH